MARSNSLASSLNREIKQLGTKLYGLIQFRDSLMSEQSYVGKGPQQGFAAQGNRQSNQNYGRQPIQQQNTTGQQYIPQGQQSFTPNAGQSFNGQQSMSPVGQSSPLPSKRRRRRGNRQQQLAGVSGETQSQNFSNFGSAIRGDGTIDVTTPEGQSLMSAGIVNQWGHPIREMR